MADRITIKHLRAVRGDGRGAKYCIPGTKAFFERHGLDFKDFMKNGIAISELEHIDDVMCRRVIEEARRDVE
jgi:hypothetical protein